jgi:hypothetical protein
MWHRFRCVMDANVVRLVRRATAPSEIYVVEKCAGGIAIASLHRAHSLDDLRASSHTGAAQILMRSIRCSVHDEGKRSKTPSQPPEVSTPRTVTPQSHPIGTPRGLSSNAGIVAVSAWAGARGIYPPVGKRWTVEIAMDIAPRPASPSFSEALDTRFHITINADDWAYMFCQGGRVSAVRVTDIPSVHGRDDHHLLASTPPLKNIGLFLRDLEHRYHVHFQRHHAAIHSSIAGCEPLVRAWMTSL